MLIIPLLCLVSIIARLLGIFVGKIPTRLQKIQERALRFIYRDYDSSYVILLARSQLPSLKAKHSRAIALESFKILFCISSVFK